MKARDVVGRRIVAIRQTMGHDPRTGYTACLHSITLDNGTVIEMRASETEDGGPIVLTEVHKPPRNTP